MIVPDRNIDILKQGFMKRRRPRKQKRIVIVACDKCHDWHERGKHIISAGA
jgi:hypothetical protein